jgi:hypothetical protein
MPDRADVAVAMAKQYASARLFSQAGVSPGSVQALSALCRKYRAERICLFTGAGVSFTEAKDYRTPGWWGLLFETYRAIHPELSKCECTERFEGLRDRYSRAWDIATVLADETGDEDVFLEKMRRVIAGRTGRDAKHKLLPNAYLDHAATLNAVIAFCSQLRAIREFPCYELNDRIHAVLTLNYDWFLEGGATTKHQANRFKPMVSDKSREKTGRRSVYHIHGYIPHSIRRKRKYPFVLTAQSYNDAYDDPNSFTRKKVDTLLRDYPTLFIGISFDDERLLERLEVLARNSNAQAHFALLKQGTVAEKLLNRLRSAKVLPILYNAHEQIPTILGRVYQAGLLENDLTTKVESETGKVMGSKKVTPDEYWALLLSNKSSQRRTRTALS